MNFELNNTIKVLNKYSNVDAFYGPYESIQAALDAIPEGLRGLGLTIGVINSSGKVEEYWWNTSDPSDTALTKKIEEVDLTIEPLGDTTINVEEGGYVTFRFTLGGRATVQKGFVYQVVGESEIFSSEFTNLGKGDNSITITPPSVSGVYKYRIRVIDSTGQYAKYTSELNYIEYEVRYGGISINYNFTNFDRIQIKNIQSVAGQYFTANISVRDDSFDNISVYLSDRDQINIPLLPYKNLQEPSDTCIGFNYYILPDSSVLEPLNGKFCYIKVAYTESGDLQYKYTDLFTLLDTESLEIISQSTLKEYYVNFPDYYTFLFRSGVSNLSVYVQQGQDSDFNFEPVTVTSYNNFSLRVIPLQIKTNAVIVMSCSYTINGVQKYKTFEIQIGSIQALPEREFYTPPTGGSVSLEKAVEATSDDFVDGTRYYKIELNFTSNDITTCAFIVDLQCRINQTNSKSLDGSPLKYAQIFQGDVEIGYITEDVINCRGIITDTPLNEWVQIGIAYNVKDSIKRGNKDYTPSYHAIYINGMIVKNIRIDDGSAQPLIYDATKPITIKLINGIDVLKCYVYYKNDALDSISPKADVYSIIYTNYLAHNPDFNEPGDLPVLKLMRITDDSTRLRYFDLLSNVNEDIQHLTTFGEIGLEKAQSMKDYDPKYGTSDTSVDRNDATLFRQHVDIKKPAQKEYGVLCRGQWMVNGVNALADCIIEVHTQGTSTLVYPVPNFKFTFWKLAEVEGVETLQRFTPPFIKKDDTTYYEESIYTAKADFMDSSHLNNTPTCNFYNNLIHQLIDDDSGRFDQFIGSPSAEMGNLDAIMGFPIVLEISDNATNMSDVFTNIGSFMLNIDKTGNSLGFETGTQSCLSLEGTSNDNESGAAGRFVIPDVIVMQYGDKQTMTIPSLKNYLNQDGTLNELEIEADYNLAKSTIGSVSIENALLTLPYVQWCNFLSQGLEYRYPDSDIYKEKGSKVSKILSLNHFKQIYKMWIWVCNSDNNDNYRSEFESHFDLGYCMLYFILLMIFGQTDNLGKNAMFDCWDGEHWYPRPYDLDSQAGLDNNGNDNVAPFVEIKPEFSLNYSPTYTEEELEENYLLETSMVPYGSLTYKRYHYSSNSSKLWINFYKNYKTDIESFYNNLRNSGLYTPETIIQLCENSLIDSLGVQQYNQDFNNKYLATTDQKLAYGNRWYKFKKWIRQRFAFCDSYFRSSDTGNYNIVQAISYNLEVKSPQYVVQTYQQTSTTKFVIDRDIFSSGSAAATKLTLQVNQDLVLNSTLFKYVSYQSGARNYNSIISLDVSQNKQITNIESLVGAYLPNLKDLNISNSSVTTVSIPSLLRTLSAENVQLDQIEFPQNSVIESIDLKGSTINTNISFNNLPNLKYLDLTNCTISGNITLANLPAIETFIIDNAKFNGNIIIQNNVNIDTFDFSGLSINGISFDGNDINITKLNFHSTNFTLDTVNLTAVSRFIEEIYFNGCKNLKHIQVEQGVKFQNLRVLSLYDSPITSFGDIPAEGEPGEFDASHFYDMSLLKKGLFNESTGAITLSPFTFENTKIVTINNLIWNGTGNRLFYICTELQHIYGTLTFTTNINYTFWRCLKLEALPTIVIDDSVTSAMYTFAGANLLTYQEVAAVIRNCKYVTNFTGVLFCKDLPDDTEVNLDYLFGNNNVVENITHMLCASNRSQSIDSVTNSIRLSGKVPSTVTNISYAFFYITTTVPYDILQRATSLQNMAAAFASSLITFFIPSGSSMVLPSYIYHDEDLDQDVTVTLTDTIDSKFLPESLININFAFQDSNVQIIDSNAFQNLTNLETCLSCFKNSHNRKFTLDLYVDSLWINCPNIQNIAGCFSNIINVACNTTLVFNSNIVSERTIDISGLFGLDSANENSIVTSINFSGIVPKIKTDNYYLVSGNTSRYAGVFLNRKVRITDSNTIVLGKISTDSINMFLGSTIYLNANINSFDLSNVTNAQRMFESCSTYSDEEIPVRKFITVTLPTNCSNYYRTFCNSYILSELPSQLNASAQNVSYMFSSCVINQNSVVLPSNYFQLCKNNISDASYMFYRNIYLTELEYNSNVGLFQGCINLQNVSHMFDGTYFLHKGIPNNLFGTTVLPKITSLQYMFADSSIFFDVEDEATGGKRWVTSNTIAPLINLSSVEGLFYRMRIGNNTTPAYTYRDTVKDMDGYDMQVISQDTFINHNLKNIRRLFYRTSTVQNIPFAFLGFEYGEDAFCDSRITEISSPFITNDTNLWNVRNVARMFGMRLGNTKSVTNLGAFITSLKNTSNPVMSNIAGNLTNTDIDDQSLMNDFNLDVDYGHSLNTKVIY